MRAVTLAALLLALSAFPALAAGALTVTTDSVPGATLFESYSQTLAASGGTAPYAWSVDAGSLPQGLSLSASTGAIAGSPTLLGASNFTVKVTDSASPAATATQALAIVVAMVDTDSDGMPDNWEIDFFDDLAEGPGGDPDADGVTNINEFLRGSDPSQFDNVGPYVTLVASIPTKVRRAVDLTVRIVISANDSARGRSNIVGGECWVGADPGLGNGVPATASDGAFDHPSESLIATLDCSAWTTSTTVSGRVLDASGNWSDVDDRVVEVVEGVSPGAVTDLVAAPAGSFEYVPNSVSAYSSDSPDHTINRVMDANTSTYWQTAGSVTRDTEYVTLDVLSVRSVASVLIVPPSYGLLFPPDFIIETSEDGVEWTKVVTVSAFKPTRPYYVWQFEPVDARYIKMSGPGVLNPFESRYYWRVADVLVYNSQGSLVALRWTAPGDDGYLGGSVSAYQVRWRAGTITDDNWSASTVASGLGAPQPAGRTETGTVRIDSTDSVIFVAMKSVDAAGNWSAVSNSPAVNLNVTGFVPSAPADAAAASADPPSAFQYRKDANASGPTIVFSGAAGFPPRPVPRVGGGSDRVLRFPVRASTFTPTAAQWTAIKKLVGPSGALYWRLEGALGIMGIFGPARSLVFDTGEILGSFVADSHSYNGEEALWPDPALPPVFNWTYDGDSMAVFNVAVSTSVDVPLTNRRVTVILGGRGVAADSCAATLAEWKKLRKLASSSNGALYWRVVGYDSAHALSCAGEVQTLLVNPGDWSVPDVDLSAAPGIVTWTHDAEYAALYNVEWSVDGDFKTGARYTLVIPLRATAEKTYTLSDREMTLLRNFAARNSLTTLRYRVRATDPDKSFITRSPSASATLE